MHDDTAIMLMWCNAWDLKLIWVKTHPKISTITHQLWKTPKPRFQNMNACKWKRSEAYQVKENLEKLEKSLGKRFGVREIVFGRWTGADRSREIKEMRTGSRRENIYLLSNSRQIEVSKGVEPSVKEGVEKNNVDRCRCRDGVEK